MTVFRASFIRLFVLLVLLSGAAGCAVFAPAPTPGQPVELTTPTPIPTRRPSPTPRRIESATPRPTGTPTPLPPPTRDPALPTETPRFAPPAVTLDPGLLTALAPAGEGTPLPAGASLIGESGRGLPITRVRIGTGSRPLLLVGGIHGGWEVNTIDLMNALIDHFSETPGDIAPGLALEIVPALNPDGVLARRDLIGRFNNNGVDLNRNWACGWTADARWQGRRVDPGDTPFSEPESAALADYILLNAPAAVIVYHSAGGGIYPGACAGDHGSAALAAVYAGTAGYPLYGAGEHEDGGGNAADWVDGQRIPGLTVELSDWVDAELTPNLAGIMGVQCTLLAEASDPASQAWRAAHCGDGE